jgi:hypothetical protein
MGEIVNLNKARKARRKADAGKAAATNRAQFGRSKAEKALEQARRDKAGKDLDAARRDPSEE